jgi:hypothetical protein
MHLSCRLERREQKAPASDDKTTASLMTRYLRKPGQSRFDPQSGRETTGQFESEGRFELLRAGP